MRSRLPSLLLLGPLLAGCGTALPAGDGGTGEDSALPGDAALPDLSTVDLQSDLALSDLTAVDLAGDAGPPRSCGPSGACQAGPQCGTYQNGFPVCCYPGAWCDTSSGGHLCRCLDQPMGVLACCQGADPDHPGCGNLYIPICE